MLGIPFFAVWIVEGVLFALLQSEFGLQIPISRGGLHSAWSAL